MSSLSSFRDRPMELLQAMEQRLSGVARQTVARRDSWAGVAVRLGELRVLVPQGQVREVVELPAYSRVPGARPWLIGVGNVRGELIPLVNLKGILLDTTASLDLNSRILVLKHDEIPAGFLVDRVEGLRRFDQAQKTAPKTADLPQTCSPFITEAYADDLNYWPVLDLHRLVTDAAFQMAA